MKHLLSGFTSSILPLLISCYCASVCAAAPFLLVNGQINDVIVKFDLATGNATLYGEYNANDDPRNLAVDANGVVYSSLNGGGLNIVKLVPGGGGLYVPQNFTPTVGGFGPGQIKFHNGSLYAASDASDTIIEYDGATGAVIRQFSTSEDFNIRAMTIVGDNLYYTEIFQDRVNKFDLTQVPPTGGLFFTDTTRLNESWNMTGGHGNSLVIANRADTLIQRFDINTGAHLGVLADIDTFNPAHSGAWDVIYNAELDNYFVSAGSSIYRLNTNGDLLQTYQSALLQGATGMAIVPEPSTVVLFLTGALGLVGNLYRRRNKSRA